jgi:MFS transporter, PAT family, beta-lactamase induction signal transducer AmpG
VRPRPGLPAKLAILAVFYVVQGLPFGFQATALPIYLTASGISLTQVAFAGALSAPWLLKPVWAPLVDRYSSARFGRRRSWIVPLQAALASTCLAAAFVPAESLALLLGLIALTNLFAATMDIAVDGLAIDLLGPEELGFGNIAQVVGFKFGMVIGGGLLVWASRWIGWSGLFMAIAGLIFTALLITLAWREPEPDPAPDLDPGQDPPPHTSFRTLFRTLGVALRQPGGLALILVVTSYKVGESVADAMFEPFLVRHAQWSESDIGLVIGVWGMLLSLLGSFLGGWLASRAGVYRALVGFAVARTLSIAALVWLGTLAPAQIGVVEVVLAKGSEELAGGGLTTAMFALMMARVDRRVGATHYTLLAGLEVAGKSPGALLSGALADAIGFVGVFATGFGLSLAFLPLLALVRARHVPPQPT